MPESKMKSLKKEAGQALTSAIGSEAKEVSALFDSIIDYFEKKAANPSMDQAEQQKFFSEMLDNLSRIVEITTSYECLCFQDKLVIQEIQTIKMVFKELSVTECCLNHHTEYYLAYRDQFGSLKSKIQARYVECYKNEK